MSAAAPSAAAASKSGGDDSAASSGSGLTNLFVGVVAAAGALTLGYVGYSYSQYNKQNEQKKLQKPKPNFKSGTAAASAGGDSKSGSPSKSKSKLLSLEQLPPLVIAYTPKTGDCPEPAALATQLKAAIEEVKRTNNPSALRPKFIDFIRQTRVEEYTSGADRIESAQFLILYYTFRVLYAPSEVAQKDAIRNQTLDFPLMWGLIQLPAAQLTALTDGERRKLDVFALDIATRMEDGVRMAVLLERMCAARGIVPVIQKGKTASSAGASGTPEGVEPIPVMEQELQELFSVAALIGQWSRFRLLGDLLSQLNNSMGLKLYHIRSMNDNQQPDLTHLHTLSENELNTYGDVPVTALAWKRYQVRSLKLKLTSTQAAEPSVSAALRKDFDAYGGAGADGKDVCVPGQVVMRSGAYAQMLVHAPNSTPLIGPMLEHRLLLSGYVDIPYPTPRCQREEYVLKLESTKARESVWTGTYSIGVTSTAHSAGGGAPAVLSKHDFSVKLVLYCLDGEYDKVEQMTPL